MAKHRIEGKVRAWHHMVFKVQKVAAGEEEVVLHFGHPVKHDVVKLDVKDLPLKDRDGTKIHWINNFAVVDAKGKYMDKVDYTLFLKARKRAHFVYYEHGRIKHDKQPLRKGRRSPRHWKVQVVLNSGDPGAGWT